MVLGVLIGRKKYPLLKYLFILMIVAGVAMFMYKDSGKKGQGTYLSKQILKGVCGNFYTNSSDSCYLIV